MPSQFIRDLLVGGHAPKLRHLDLMHVIPGIFHFRTGLELDAEDLLAKTKTVTSSLLKFWPAARTVSMRPFSWTCLNLVYLRIKIHNFLRTDIIPPKIASAASLSYDSESQRAVQGQIGRLVHLEELGFGNKDDQLPDCLQYNANGEPLFQWRYTQFQSLSLTLEQGLDGLSPLKKLRVLDVTCVSHKISDPRIGLDEAQFGQNSRGSMVYCSWCCFLLRRWQFNGSDRTGWVGSLTRMWKPGASFMTVDGISKSRAAVSFS